jgi:hypothetical protein
LMPASHQIKIYMNDYVLIEILQTKLSFYVNINT